MDLINELKNAGCDIDSALERFMGNADLYLMLVKKIPDSLKTSEQIIPKISAGDIDGAIAIAHTIKGNTGNLSLTPLYSAYTKIVDLLRAGNPGEAGELTKIIMPVQEKIINIINCQ